MWLVAVKVTSLWSLSNMRGSACEFSRLAASGMSYAVSCSGPALTLKVQFYFVFSRACTNKKFTFFQHSHIFHDYKMFRNIADIENPSDQGVRFDVPPTSPGFIWNQAIFPPNLRIQAMWGVHRNVPPHRLDPWFWWEDRLVSDEPRRCGGYIETYPLIAWIFNICNISKHLFKTC